jgi:hypothetical protein
MAKIDSCCLWLMQQHSQTFKIHFARNGPNQEPSSLDGKCSMHQRRNEIHSSGSTLTPAKFSDISEALRNIGERDIICLAPLRSRFHYCTDLSDVSPQYTLPQTLAHFLRGAVDESVH